MLRRRPLPVLFALALASLPLLAVADEGKPSPAAALRAAEVPLRDRDWAKAATELRAMRDKFPGTPEALEAWVLEARALFLAGRARESLDAATSFLQANGEAAWAGRMKSTMADAYASLKAEADAVRVLRERAEFLTGDDHRGKVAGLYVALGDQDFDGRDVKDELGRPVKKKDFAQAYRAYSTALAIGVAPSDVLRVRARAASSLEEIGNFPAAVAAWDALVKEGLKGPGADPEAWLVGRGRARLKAGDLAAARKDLRDALETYPNGALHLEILRLLAQERLTAAAQKGQGPESDLLFEEGVQYLRRAIAEHRDDKAAAAVQRTLAEAYAGRGAWEKAAAEWRGLVERFPADPDAPVWRDALAQALANAGRFDDAVTEWKAFLSAFPNHPLWQHVQEMIPAARFAKGQMLASQEQVDAAVAAFRAFAEEFPTDARAPAALVAAGTLLRGRKDFEGAIATWRGVTGRYAGSPEAPIAWLLVAQTLEDDLQRLDEAVKEYEELLKKHPQVAQAQQRLARLRGKHLEVRSERVVGSKDPSVLKVVTRNIPALKVKVYKLGLEDYFRRKQTVAGVENVQLEIVKPDATAEWKVDPYAPFALLQAERAVPVTGPGAYVVVAGDDDLTSTTLLIVSDIEAVVKSAAGRQVFAWVRNRATGEPVEGARILSSDGSTVFAEGKTGKDGVYLLDTNGTARRVLVLSGDHAASTEWEPGQVFAEGWQSKAHVSTDRPVYRPGQKVQFRAIYRRADGGSYRIPAGAKGVVVLLNARGAEVERKDVVASDLGIFTGEFDLDGEAPLGDWTIRLDVDRKTFPGTFRVLEYRKPEFFVAVEPGKPSYLTGEEVKAKVRLTYAFGGPVAGAPVRWQVTRVPHDFTPSAVNDYSWYFQDPDALERARNAARTAPQGVIVAQGETKTDDRGEAAISFPTTERDEDAEYVVTASAIDVTRRFVGDEGRIPVVQRDTWAVVTTDRRVFRPKQEIRATIQTVDANQSPVSRAGDATLVRVRRVAAPPVPPTPAPGRRIEDGRAIRMQEEEIEVQKVPVTTDAKGRAEVRLLAPGPGTFRVRWSSTDARGHRITAFAAIDVAGDAEDLSKDARLVAAKETYTEGERAEVLLQSPVSKVKALLTFEGEKVLAYRLVDVDGPSTILDVPIEGSYAPNITLKVAIPGKDKLLEADDEIIVFRFLQVALAASKATALPGEEISVEVTTTDAAGKPVPAEVGVAVVDEALYAISPDRSPALRPFFYDRKRVDRVVTSSSVGFRTYGATRETNKDLLANQEARDGDPNAVFAQGALRLAREALQRGDMQTAVGQALAAAASDPSSWDARNLVSELRSRPEAKDALKLLDDAKGDELRAAGELAREMEKQVATFGAVSKSAPTLAAKPRGGGAPLPPPSTPPPPGAIADAAMAEHGEEDFDREAGPAESADKAKDGKMGTGGGAGGLRRKSARAYGGRSKGEPQSGGGSGGIGADSRILEAGNAPARFEVFATKLYGTPTGAVGDLAAFRQGFGLADGPVLPPSLRKTFADTAAWLPNVTTDALGKAVVKVKLPDNLTRWRATGRGISGESLVGEGKTTFVARRDLLLRVDAPRFLVQGDEATVPSAVHNESGTEVTATVTMKAEGVILGGSDGTVVIPAGGRAVRDRDVSAKDAGAVRIEAEATSPFGGDRVETALRSFARGIRRIEGRSGTISTSGGETQETFFDLSAVAIPSASSLTVVLYPGFDAAILDALAYLDLYPYGCVEQTVHRVLPAAWARTALVSIASPDAKRLAELGRALASSVGRLRNMANDDGSFGWWRGGQGNVSMTALALLALREAAKANVAGAQDAVNRTAAALRAIVRSAPDDVAALAHWALAEAGSLDEEAYQVTFRRRNEELSVPGLAYLAFAAQTLGREFDADDLARLILARRVEEKDTTRWAGRKDDCFVGSERLATALAVRALVEVGASAEAAERGMRWLITHRVEGGFGTTMETAAFVGACSSWVAKARPAAYGGSISVLLDGTEVRKVTVPAGSALAPTDRRFGIDVTKLAAGRHTLSFKLVGQGEVPWAARLETVEASEVLAAEGHGMDVDRLYLDPEIPAIEGAQLPPKPGYDVLRPSARPRVEAKSRDRAGTGERLLVRLTLTAPRDLQYVLLEDPLPAGFEVLDETSNGAFDWQERRDDRQVFFLSNVKAGTVVVSYMIQAVHLGAFTALPARSYAMYLPEVNGRSAGHRLTVAATSSQGSSSESPPTPDEVFAVAKALLEKKSWAEAAQALSGLKALPLRDEIVEEIEAALLRCAIETKDTKEIVRAREELVRRNPARIPSDLSSMRAIAAAYADLGAHGVASNLLRDLVARSFDLEARWSTYLKERGREVDGLTALAEALKAYPVGNGTAAASLERATRFRDLPRPEGGTGKVGAPMNQEGLDALYQFAAHYAETSLAAPGGYAIVEGLRRVRDLDGAVSEATLFPKRFPDSPFVDDTLFFLMDSRLQKFEAAPSTESAAPVLAAAQRLSKEKFRTGGTTEYSEFRPRAFHTIGRVQHVLGDLAAAIESYKAAAPFVEDAREALAYLTEARLDLEETVNANVVGTAAFPMRYRNVGEVRFKAYPVDLQVLFAMRRTLVGLNRIDLSGITPAQEWTVTPKDGNDHGWHDMKVDLPLGKDAAGVFLVVAKTGNLEASTIVVKTDLEVTLQRVGEKVRVHVTGRDGRGVRGAYVTVSDGKTIRARGMTDGRGVFEAPGVGANAFVVANVDDRYAIAR